MKHSRISGQDHDGTATIDSRSWTRRRVLAGSSALGFALLAGCGGNDGGDGGDGNGGDGGDGDDDSGDIANGGTGGGNGGGDGGSGNGTGQIGSVVAGETIDWAVEYVRPLETVVDYQRVPRTTEVGEYGEERTIEFYQGVGLASQADSFYAVGVAMRNTHDRPLNVLTALLLDGDGNVHFGLFPSESQRLATFFDARQAGNVLAPGELRRGELVFALPREPANYLLRFEPYSVDGKTRDQLTVDLGTGSETTVDLSQQPSPANVGETIAVGDFEVTLHSAEFVESITDSPYQDIFGPREGFRYFRLDLSATRNSDVTIGQQWSLGVVDAEGYEFAWTGSYQDALDLRRPTLDRLDVGESIEHTILAFPLEEEFEPTYIGMNASGPFEDAPQLGPENGMHRGLWTLA